MQTGIRGVPLSHLPWTLVQAHLRAVAIGARGEERVWLRQLSRYLRGAIKVRSPSDSWVYCVVVSKEQTGRRR